MDLINNDGSVAAMGQLQNAINTAAGMAFTAVKDRKSYKWTKKLMAAQQRYALEQMQKQAELNQAFYDYQNEYNDPTNLLSRWRRAGILPSGVVGSSGTHVTSTPTSSMGVSTPGGPTQSFKSSFGDGVMQAMMDPVSFAMLSSNVERNRAAANRDNAEADSISARNLGSDYYAAIGDLNKSIMESNVKDAEAVARMNSALADIYQADASYADLTATYKFQDLIASYSRHVEEYQNLRQYNVKYFDSIMTSQIVKDFALAYSSMQSGDLAAANTEIARVTAADLRNWFDVNWESEISVPEVDENGKRTGQTVKMTGKEIHERLLGLAVPSSEQSISETWFRTRSQKNAFGYELANTALRGALSIVGARVGGAAVAAAGSSTSMHEVREKYNRYGEFVGGTTVRRDSYKGR